MEIRCLLSVITFPHLHQVTYKKYARGSFHTTQKSFCREEQTRNFALKNFRNYRVHDEQYILIIL